MFSENSFEIFEKRFKNPKEFLNSLKELLKKLKYIRRASKAFEKF